MTAAITLFLAIVLSLGTIAWFGNRRQAVALAVIAVAALPAALLPLGYAAPWRPACNPCAILGARIDPEEAIWVLLDGPEPRFHKLPYSASAANSLQAALDGAAESQGRAKMKLGEDGSPGFFEEAPPPPEPVKAAREQPVLQ